MFHRKRLSINATWSTTTNRLYLTSREFEALEETVQTDVFSLALGLSPRSLAFRPLPGDDCLGFVPELLEPRVHVVLRRFLAKSGHDAIPFKRAQASSPSPLLSPTHYSPARLAPSTPADEPLLELEPVRLSIQTPRDSVPDASPGCDSPVYTPSEACEPASQFAEATPVYASSPRRRGRARSLSGSETACPEIAAPYRDLKDAARAEMYLSHVRENVRVKMASTDLCGFVPKPFSHPCNPCIVCAR